MPLPTMDEAVDALHKYGDHPRDTAIATVTINAAVLQAVVQQEAARVMSSASRETAETMAAASKALGLSKG